MVDDEQMFNNDMPQIQTTFDQLDESYDLRNREADESAERRINMEEFDMSRAHEDGMQDVIHDESWIQDN